MKNDRTYVYVLKLHGSPPNWYVGSTNNVEARMCEHWSGQGAQWTQKHPPSSVMEVIECPGGDPLPLERAKTAQFCMIYGWGKVRGGGHIKVEATMPSWFDQEGTKRKRTDKSVSKQAMSLEQWSQEEKLCRFINPPEEPSESGDNTCVSQAERVPSPEDRVVEVTVL